MSSSPVGDQGQILAGASDGVFDADISRAASSITLRKNRRSWSHRVIGELWALTEFLIVFGVGVLIYVSYVSPKEPQFVFDYLSVTVIYSLVLGLSLAATGQYKVDKIARPLRSLKKVSALSFLIFMIMVLCGVLLKVTDHFSRVWAFSWMISILTLLPLFRMGLTRFAERSAVVGALTKDIIIYGIAKNGRRVIRQIQKLEQPWNRIVGVYDDRSERILDEIGGFSSAGGTDELIRYVQTHGCDEILLTMPLASPERFLELATKLGPLPVNVRIVPDITVFDLPQLPATSGGMFGIPMIRVLKKPVSEWGVIGKWLVDIGATSLAMVFALPLMALVAIAIKIDSRGPVFFKQQREGFCGQMFDVYKFRTMYVDCEDIHADKLVTKGDPRVTRVGSFLRRFSIDELPQLLNVLKRDMSLVGPRPHALMAKAGGKFYKDVLNAYSVRMKVKPGLTGWAQVHGWRGNTETEDDLKNRVEFDIYYIENWSLRLDIIVLLKTVWIVLEGENSY